MREWVAIQQLFSLGRTCLNYPNESEWLWLPRRQGTLQGHTGEAVEQRPQCVCVYVRQAGCGCPVKLNGACRVPNEPVLAGGLTHSDLPLCTSLSHLGCQGMAVNLSLPWTLAFTKPIHIFNKGLEWRILMSQYVGLTLFLSCLVKIILRLWPGKSQCCYELQVKNHARNVTIFLVQYSWLSASWHKVMEATSLLYINLSLDKGTNMPQTTLLWKLSAQCHHHHYPHVASIPVHMTSH